MKHIISPSVALILSLSLSLSPLPPNVLTAFAAEDNFHILGSTAPNASVIIDGENTTISSPLIHKTLAADAQGIFRADFMIDKGGIYVFSIYAQKDGATTEKVSFATNIQLSLPTTISGVEVPFPQEINGKPEKCERKSDLNGDGRVNLTDFSILLSQWRTFDCKTDLDKSGRVDLKDLSIMLEAWSK